MYLVRVPEVPAYMLAAVKVPFRGELYLPGSGSYLRKVGLTQLASPLC